MKKLAIIGASYLQEPLIQKAKAMGIQTHVFAWESGDAGEKSADCFYPISIVEKDAILETCRHIKIDGICSIASDLAAITVNYVADALGLTGNSIECSKISTNKHLMRRAFAKNGDPSVRSILVESEKDLENVLLQYPVIVKPTDRSGSRGIRKVDHPDDIRAAIENAKMQGFEKKALVEEFADGEEYSVECISYQGRHYFLAMTKKYTTGAPCFIETGHLEPAPVSDQMLQRVKRIVFHALDTLKITNSASHTELKINKDGKIVLIETGGRMGGDCIGSDLVFLSTGIDFVKAVIQVALGEKPDISSNGDRNAAAIRYIFTEEDLYVLQKIKKEHPEYLVREARNRQMQGEITDSSTRFGAYLLKAASLEALREYLPKQQEES